ncbi:MAG: MFS transporter [Moraxellaceae bacterium]|nr:MFS transporter [Moraxellaceae bacterium]
MKQLRTRLMILAGLVLLIAATLLSVLSLKHFDDTLTPQLQAADREIGTSVLGLIDRAMKHGVPFEALVGVEDYFDDMRKDHPRLEYLWVTNTAGQTLFLSRAADVSNDRRLSPGIATWNGKAGESATIGDYMNTALPIMHEGRQIGWLHVGQRADVSVQMLRGVVMDILTVLLVTGLIAFELLRLLLALAVSRPLLLLGQFFDYVRQGDLSHYLPRDIVGGVGRLNVQFNRVLTQLRFNHQQYLKKCEAAGVAPAQLAFDMQPRTESNTLALSEVDYIRWPFFLLVFADSLSLSFFPLFAGKFYDPAIGISHQLLVSLPISLFMLVWALSMLWAGRWCDRVGYRKAFGVGAGITTLGLVLTGLSQDFYQLLLWRSLTAIGFGAVFVTAQSYITSHTPPEQRTRGMAVFLSTFFAGSLAGASIGGILADRLGYDNTFLVSAVLSALAAIFVMRFLTARQPAAASAASKRLGMAQIWTLLQHKQFATITFLAAVPSKIALTGFLYYSVPLYLKTIGTSQSDIGRIMMAYGLAIILLSSHIARLADMLGNRRWFVSLGGIAAAVGMAVTSFNDSAVGVLIGIVCLGVAHAIGVSPQLALVSDYCRDAVNQLGQATTTGIFRLMERLGNVSGPLIASVLIANFGFNGAFMGVALLTLITTLTFTFLFLGFERGGDKSVKEA